MRQPASAFARPRSIIGDNQSITNCKRVLSAPSLQKCRRAYSAKGYQSVFLDLERDDGIVAGEKWEQVLYRELRTCQVVITLMSEYWLNSRWCFAEATHAREPSAN